VRATNGRNEKHFVIAAQKKAKFTYCAIAAPEEKQFTECAIAVQMSCRFVQCTTLHSVGILTLPITIHKFPNNFQP
jgi:hypothetical protein